VVGEDRFDQQAEYEKTFMTYHCYATSANWFGEDDWIDMHTWGSYHEKRNNDRAIYAAWAEWDRVNHKPHVNSEPAYENLPINYDWANVSQGVFDDFDARQVAYWSVFGGAAGHTYGGHEVWIMHKFSNPHPALTQRLEIEWEEALDLKGAGEMQHLKNLMLSQDPLSRRPNLTVIADNPHDPTGRLLACSGDGYIMVYAPTGKTIQLKRSEIGWSASRSQWFNPREGHYAEASMGEEGELLVFDPPGEPERGNDWVLLLTGK
ncbi:MAG: DUF4038 domain-containing protein, partial [Bacteroidota bacterium]